LNKFVIVVSSLYGKKRRMDEHDLCDFMMSFTDDIDEKIERDVEAAGILFKHGMQLLEEKRLLDAQECFEKASQLNPSNREPYRLYEELRLRLGPSKNEDSTIYVRDPHKQLGTLILRAGECHSWFRREVPGVYDMAMYLSTERGNANWEYYRVVAIAICVFTHEYKAARVKLEEIVQKIKRIWGFGARVNPLGGDELPPYFEVILRPEYETQEIERIKDERDMHDVALACCDDEHQEEKGVE
jgi:hypothetical protein